jgi:hypothetical protein
VTARLSSPPRTRAGSFGSRLSGRVFMACFLVWGQGGGGPGARRAAVRGRPWAVKALGTCIGSALSAGLGVHCSRVLGLCASAQPAAGSRASECSFSGSAQPQAANQAFRPQLSESLCLSGITSFRAYRHGTGPGRGRWMPMLRCDSTRVPLRRTLGSNIVEYVRVPPKSVIVTPLTQTCHHNSRQIK